MKFKLPDKEGLSPNYSRKISELVLELAEEIASRDSPPKVFANAVRLAVLLWNIPLLPKAAQTMNMDHIGQWLAQQGRLDFQTEIARLLELRKTRYGTDHRMVMDIKLEYEAIGPRLSVVSRDMDQSENRNRKA